MDVYDKMIRQTGKEENVPVVDAYVNWKQMKKDGMDTMALQVHGMHHPNPEMHKVFADALLVVIFADQMN